jgi:hypothetical protein
VDTPPCGMQGSHSAAAWGSCAVSSQGGEVMAALCHHASPLQRFQPGICLEASAHGGFQ